MNLLLQTQLAIRLDPADDVAIALMPLPAGRTVAVDGVRVPLTTDVPVGHKFALRPIDNGMPVRRYGQVIGFATAPIAPGEHVHTENLHVGSMELDYAFGADRRPVRYVPESERRTFQGYRRADGRVGTRNSVVLITTVNCAAHTARMIAQRARAELLPRFPNVDDVVALVHKNGCGTKHGSPELDTLQRTLAGHANHPNVAAYIFVGLGCEVNQFYDLVGRHALNGPRAPLYLGIQDTGGVAGSIAAGLDMVASVLPQADEARRVEVPVSELVVGLECGGSDSFSGITANPALGLAVDWLVAQGGTAALAETPEVYGAEHLLTRRAVSPEVGQKLVDQIHWWEEYTARHNFEIDNNPAPGNKAGGLTTIYEKSLGAIAKGGSTPLQAVYDYAERITERGFVFMDTPGYDPVSVTGLAAGGCNLIAFTTGRGSCFGYKPVPSIKIATNSTTYRRMAQDMDIDAGAALEGGSLQGVADEIVEQFIAVASGKP
ncbi:MAG: altronate dehydratase family protein, partial [Chloroflexota bacterium]|nr:altronate dehydratase family protein [Chloroflexota bacterium]